MRYKIKTETFNIDEDIELNKDAKILLSYYGDMSYNTITIRYLEPIGV